jgi:hypothetical protein
MSHQGYEAFNPRLTMVSEKQRISLSGPIKSPPRPACRSLVSIRARLCAHSWIRDLVAEGQEAGLSIFVKQLAVNGRVSADPADWPEDLRIQEFPACP